MVAGERHQMSATLAVWLSLRGLGGAEVLAVAPNTWVDQQTRDGLREWHRNLADHGRQRDQHREEVVLT